VGFKEEIVIYLEILQQIDLVYIFLMYMRKKSNDNDRSVNTIITEHNINISYNDKKVKQDLAEIEINNLNLGDLR
jgi:hypothetical protein